jgi:hypothetical protein
MEEKFPGMKDFPLSHLKSISTKNSAYQALVKTLPALFSFEG